MKRFTLILLAALMLLTLASCGANDKYAKYDDLIACLEAEDYEGAYAELVSLASKGASEPDADGPDSTESAEPETEVINITLENWQDYFEVRQGYRVDRNDFDDPTAVYVGLKLHVKDEYKDKIVEADVALQYKKSGSIAALMEYNDATETLTIGEPLTEEYLSENCYSHDPEETDEGTATFTGYDAENGLGLGGFQGGWPSSLVVEGDVVRWDGSTYTQCDITRIEGTITLEK